VGHFNNVKPTRRIQVAGLLIVAGLCIAAALNGSPFGPKRYGGAEATFRVVDDQRQPIAGAIVLMAWSFVEPNGHSERVFHVVEAESDSAGDVRVPAWGPLDTPSGTRMKNNTPDIRIFKPGHLVFFGLNTTAETWESAPALMPLKWNGQVIVLAPADRRSKHYLNQLDALVASLDFFLADHQCWSVPFHRMIDVLNPELDELVPRDLAGREIRPNRSECQPADAAAGT
jgi:hypothetical protein